MMMINSRVVGMLSVLVSGRINHVAKFCAARMFWEKNRVHSFFVWFFRFPPLSSFSLKPYKPQVIVSSKQSAVQNFRKINCFDSNPPL